MSERRVELFCDGVLIVGLYGVPEAPGPHPAVVFCVGFSLVKEVWLLAFARRLRAAGFATLNLDYRTFGESGGEPRCRLSPRLQVEDVRAGLDFLQAQPEVDPARLGVFGISLGATIAAGVAPADRRVRGGVIVAGPGDMERVWSAMPGFAGFRDKVLAARRKYATTGEVSYVRVEKLLSSDPESVALLVEEQKQHPRWRLEVTFESLADLFEFSAERGLERSRGLMFVHPAGDVLIPATETVSMHARAGEPKELVMLEGLRHAEIYGEGRGFELVAGHAERWLGAQLRAGTQQV